MKEWKDITADPWILNSLLGIEIPFTDTPRQNSVPFPFRLSKSEKEAVDSEIDKFLDKRIVEQVVHQEGEWISNLFVRPKRDGSYRLILDLTELNKYIEYEHFKMCSLQTALELVQQGKWMASIDLKDVYFSFLIRLQDRKLLRFIWGDCLYQFRCLPNGLACAPRFFTKLLTPVFAKARLMGYDCYSFIDDSFIAADTESECHEAVDTLAKLLDRLGLVVHPEKSVLCPRQHLQFLGFIIDSRNMTVRLTEEKVEKFKLFGHKLITIPYPTIRECAVVVGLMTAYSHGVEYGQAHSKALELDRNSAFGQNQGNFDAHMTISREGRVDVEWWLRNVEKSVRIIRSDIAGLTMFTDASLLGWGASLNGIQVGGRWLASELSHINVLELKAILLGLQSLCRVNNTHIHIKTDNTTALTYVRKMGGVRSAQCNAVAQLIWSWAECGANWLSVSHVRGVDNARADTASRQFNDNIEWELHPRIYRKICIKYGTPQIDLFASRLNNKCDIYCSWKPDPGATFTDAFSLDWTDIDAYAFPPFSMVLRVLNKATQQCPRTSVGFVASAR